MIAAIIGNDGTKRVVEATPRCGDYCDTCGDCLHCYNEAGYEPCLDGHRWVLYEDIDADRIAELLPAEA
jgi:hypothetical protein